MTRGPNRVLALLVGAVLLLAVVAGIVVANRSAPALDPETPEGTLQAFLQALVDEDYGAAADFLSASSACDAADIVYYPDSSRIVLDRVTVDGDTAVVTVRVTESGGDPFGGSGWSHTERVTLEREDGDWKVTGSPWLLYCEEPLKVRP